MMDFFNQLSAWHWVILGVGLLAIEALGAGGFMIGASLAAFAVAILNVIFPSLNWQFQLAIFSFLAVIGTWAYWKRFKKYNQATDSPELNDRARQLVGRTIKLQEPIENGFGRVQIGDTYWKVRCSESVPTDSSVKVIDSEGMTLIVEAFVKDEP